MANTPPKKKFSAKNIAAGFLMALLAISLLGFGVEGFGSRVQSVATVGDREITADEYARTMQSELRSLQSQFGQAVTMEQARLFGIDQMVLERLVTSAVLDNETERLGISAGDTTVREAILDIEAFRGLDGQIDREAYRFALQNAGMTETEFERSIREDVARTILQMSVIGGAAAPETVVRPLLEYQAQTRDVSVTTLTDENLPEPIGLPDDATLRAFYEENIDDYMQPAGKRLAYAIVTPDMVIDTLDVDDAILRQAYEARISDFSQPERRLVERLVFPDRERAADAIARIEAGEADFETLVAERGLDLEDTDLGDVSRAQLGLAGDMVFDLEEPGVVGPVDTALGPALFRMNAILAARETSFEEARDELRDEQLADLARRTISDNFDLYEDLLAGGATIEQLAAETDMRAGEIDWRPGKSSGVAAYESFREVAETVEEGDFAELGTLQNGGLFAVEFVEALPEEPLPLDDIRDEVTTDWRNARILDALRSEAEALVNTLQTGAEDPGLAIAPVRFDGVRRTDFLPDLSRELIEDVFEMSEGDARSVEETDRIHILHLHAVHSPDTMLDEVEELRQALEMQIEQSLAEDIFAYFGANLREGTSIRINQQMIDAVQANF